MIYKIKNALTSIPSKAYRYGIKTLFAAFTRRQRLKVI